ncbi:hypothetical protein [Vibrio jasicida]|uniref:hypothetical protein n=1 Tax=Vibrio jasicida TaxID=766224 RepID=UPI0006AD06C6|nr:hypothetical protein [Vibrio jasicida]
MKILFEPFNALLFLCMVLISFAFKPTTTKTVFRPVIKSKRSLTVKLRFMSKWFNEQVPFLAPVVMAIAGVFYFVVGDLAAVGVILFVCILPSLFSMPSQYTQNQRLNKGSR